MADRRNGLELLDRLEPPEMWPEVERRASALEGAPRSYPAPVAPMRRLAAAVIALSVGALGTGLIALAFSGAGGPASPERSVIVLSVPPGTSAEQLDEVQRDLQERLDSVGVPGSTSIRDGTVVVSIPTELLDGPDGAAIENLLTATGRFELRQVLAVIAPSDPSYASTAVTCGSQRDHASDACAFDALMDRNVVYLGGVADASGAKYQLGPSYLSNEGVASARVIEGSPRAVEVTLSASGASRFARITAALFGKQLAMVLDRHVLSAPTVQTHISSGVLRLSGAMVPGGVRYLAAILDDGPLPVAVSTAPNPSPSPTVSPLGQATGLDALVFADAEHGWAGGSDGILATSDAGVSWEPQDAGRTDVLSIDALDATHVWAAGVDRLLRTSDGGRTWSEANEPDGWWLTSTRFLSPTVGFGIGQRLVSTVRRDTRESALFRTDDGGDSWTKVLEGPSSVCFANPSIGYAAEGDALLKTTDGGSTWTQLFEPPVLSGDYLTMLACPTPQAVWYVVRMGQTVMNQEGYVLFRSTDGGASFDALATGPYVPVGNPSVHTDQTLGAELGPFETLSPSSAVFLGFCPACGPSASVTITTDGGRSFDVRDVPGSDVGGGIWFFDELHGLIAVSGMGEPDRILETEDGGRTWTQVSTSPGSG
jgi:photosystem II stability/assembly factor-like uncharacterized protein